MKSHSILLIHFVPSQLSYLVRFPTQCDLLASTVLSVVPYVDLSPSSDKTVDVRRHISFTKEGVTYSGGVGNFRFHLQYKFEIPYIPNNANSRQYFQLRYSHLVLFRIEIYVFIVLV